MTVEHVCQLREKFRHVEICVINIPENRVHFEHQVLTAYVSQLISVFFYPR